MRHPSSFLLGPSVLLLCLSLAVGCQVPMKPKADDLQAPTAAPSRAPGTPSRFSVLEVQPFTSVEGLRLSPDFVAAFHAGLRQQLQKGGLAGQVIGAGDPIPNADPATSAVVAGRFTEYKQGGAVSAGIVGSEIKLYRKSDQTLLVTLSPRVPYKPSPFNTDKTLGEVTGARTAAELIKTLQP